MNRDRTSPNPFPFDSAISTPLGAFRYVDHKRESQHVAVGRPGWMPMLYALCLAQWPAPKPASTALARYLTSARVYEGQAALEDWDTRTEEEKTAWKTRLQAHADLLVRVWERLPGYGDSGAADSWRELLWSMCPPGRGIVLEASREYAEWIRREEHKAWEAVILQRHGWLQSEVAREFEQGGFRVDGALFALPGYEPLVHDEWDIYSF